MVATRKLFRGECILEEIPFLQADTQDFKSATYVTSALEQLSNEKRKIFKRLHNMFPEQNDVGIINTNCYALGCDGYRSGVFENLSYLNHSCRPNAERWWDPERGVETVYAIREIQENEEITVSYAGVFGKTHEERQSYLFRGWRFECLCECCELTGQDKALSDKYRRLIGRVDEMVGFVAAKQMLPLIRLSLECCEKELLFGAIQGRFWYDGFQMALEIGDLTEAKKFIKMAHEQYLLGTGPGSSETKRMASFVQEPTSHPSWA
jgi:hypothetical protein